MAKATTKAPTVPPRRSVVQAQLKPDSEFHMLVGGPYTEDGEVHRYGHTAVRIKTPAADVTYDFGRYGRVTGDFGAEGEGILRAWTDFGKYIAGQNVIGRATVGFVYKIFQHQTKPTNDFFNSLIATGVRNGSKERARPWLRVYKLTQNYHALGPNCTTISLDAATRTWPRYEAGADAYIKPEAVLNFSERTALRIKGVPGRIFLPANLQEFLSNNPPVRVDSTSRYP